MDQLVALQISDIHMCDDLNVAVFNRPSGLRGHDPLLCRLLANRTRTVAVNYGVEQSDIHWIISGDLTRVGHGPEFDVARDFMESVPACDRFGRPLQPTLGLPRDRYVDVPGNHDHFDGWDEENLWGVARNPPPAWTPNIFPAKFIATPWDNLAVPWRSSHGSIQFELFGVDSNSGLAHQAANRSAKGAIGDNEFALLEDALRMSMSRSVPKNVTRVRALICHHAFTKKPQVGLLKARPLRQESIDRLVKLAAQYRVAAVLTGHTHALHFRKLTVTAQPHGDSVDRSCIVYEIRCPTTLQGPAQALVNGFWAHNLFRMARDAPVVWRPRLYLLAGGRLHTQDVDDLEDLVLP
jgi:Calcineurin-like phosphoesterase